MKKLIVLFIFHLGIIGCTGINKYYSKKYSSTIGNYKILKISKIKGLGEDQGLIYGKIVDYHHKEGVSYANVYEDYSKTKTKTNDEGNFQFRLPKGKRKIVFEFLGFKTFNTNEIKLDQRQGIKLIIVVKRDIPPMH